MKYIELSVFITHPTKLFGGGSAQISGDKLILEKIKNIFYLKFNNEDVTTNNAAEDIYSVDYKLIGINFLKYIHKEHLGLLTEFIPELNIVSYDLILNPQRALKI